jgi:Flp pilus assembly protein TadD
MPANFPRSSDLVRRLAPVAASVILAVGLWGCQTSGPSDITGSLGEKADARASDPRRDLDTYRERFKANPKDSDAALKYGKALRATGQKSQAVAILEQASLSNPNNQALLAGYGRALAERLTKRCAAPIASRAPIRVSAPTVRWCWVCRAG